MPTPQEKGDSLELAVHAIESTILRSSPSYHEKTFGIETKKIMTVASVRHEVDIWVSVDLGGGYEAFFIFECKNWAEKVGKNEIIVFSEKIRVLQAQRGFFVAKSFTADAEAQASLDSRVTLLRVADLPVADVPVPLGFHGITVESTNVEVTFIAAGAGENSERQSIDVSTATLVIGGEPIAVEKFVNEWVAIERDKRVNSFQSQNAEERVHELPFESERRFEPRAAVLNGREMGQIRLRGHVLVRVVRPKIISHFQVATRGRALTVALDLAGAQLRTAFVEI
jgi:hypothetical protein